MKKCLILLIAFIIACFCGCNNQPQKMTSKSLFDGDHIIKDAVTDADGNSYDAVKLGEQIWMKTNLKYKGSLSKFGPDALSDAACYFEGSNGEIYYNGRAVISGVCPDGWHVPTENDWNKLERYCMTKPEYKSGISDTYIAKALADSVGWKYYLRPEPEDSNNIAYNPLTTNNATGFSARGKGHALGYDDGNFYFEYEDGERAYFWCSDFSDESHKKLLFRALSYVEPFLGHYELFDYYDDLTFQVNSFEIDNTGLSVRCVKNN